MIRVTAFTLFLIAAPAFSDSCVDFSGKWSGQCKGDEGDDRDTISMTVQHTGCQHFKAYIDPDNILFDQKVGEIKPTVFPFSNGSIAATGLMWTKVEAGKLLALSSQSVGLFEIFEDAAGGKGIAKMTIDMVFTEKEIHVKMGANIGNGVDRATCLLTRI